MGSVNITIPRLEDFDICPYLGFASAEVANPFVLNSEYEPWADAICRLSVLLATKRLRPTVHTLPMIKKDAFQSDAERRYAYLALASLVQAYVFEDKESPLAVIPPVLSEPFLKICAFWGLQPILSHIGYCLWNWKHKDGSLLREASTGDTARKRSFLLNSLDDFEPYASFTATQDEKVFSMVPLLVEAEGGVMIQQLLNALLSATAGDVSAVISVLKFCNERLTAMGAHLRILHEQCDPQFFYQQIRPLIAGSGGMETQGLPEGFIFELADGRRVPSKCIGASAAQSSLFQFLDHVFGIAHRSTFLQEMRLYMPLKHRNLLETVEQLPSLRQLIQRFPENIELQTAFGECVVHLQEWRTKHIGLATRYVVMPARRLARQEGVKGTAGALPIPFLKESRDETVLSVEMTELA